MTFCKCFHFRPTRFSWRVQRKAQELMLHEGLYVCSTRLQLQYRLMMAQRVRCSGVCERNISESMILTAIKRFNMSYSIGCIFSIQLVRMARHLFILVW
ncbi:hypothetical protein KC19_12G103600 [Ceratodon purpureus]|uniref:Uncharacterized protein n=1 Tax=Ceratodon purpureus TaxID=3225 RepID=A0A8T0G813_CERPU|nr:hypothetical protein KC19_12G103600 [Ceratodon purpureus]